MSVGATIENLVREGEELREKMRKSLVSGAFGSELSAWRFRLTNAIQRVGPGGKTFLAEVDKLAAEGPYPETMTGLIGVAKAAWEYLNDTSGIDLDESVGVTSNDADHDQVSGRVFVVHGHADAIREAVARFLEKLGLEPVILAEQANLTQPLIQKFEANSDVHYAIVLLTPDDLGGKAGEEVKPRARQNVVLELGYFMGKLGRSRVAVLYDESVELPSDLHGIAYLKLDSGGAWRLILAREMRAAGLAIDLNNAV